MTKSERPGVYTSYEISGVRYSGVENGTAGLAARADSGQEGAVYTVTNTQTAVTLFGADAPLTELVRILLLNGAAAVKAVPLLLEEGEERIADSQYESAFLLLMAEADVKILLCDSINDTVHQLMKSAILSGTGRFAHKVGIVECEEDEPSGLAEKAAALNCERMVLAAPGVLCSTGETAQRGSLSAAIAGAVFSSTDPAVPLNGAELQGFYGTTRTYTDEEISILVRGGVTPIESVGGAVTVVRGITTRTMTEGVADNTWRELTTLFVVDDVIPTVRNALKTGFIRAKNTQQTRGAIRTRVIVELEKKLRAEIIDQYDNVRVQQNDLDPTVCDVSFDFTVAHGLNQIYITAYITV